MRSLSPRTKAETCLLLVSFVWGSTFVLTKEALASMPPYTFLGLRFLLASAFLILVTLHNLKNLKWSTVLKGSIIGSALLNGYILQTVGLQYTSASHAGFITGLSVVMVPIIYALYTANRPRLNAVLGVSAAAAGLFLLSVTDRFAVAYGDLLVLGCAVGFAVHILLVGRYSGREDPMMITVVQVFFVGIITMIVGLLTEPWPPVVTRPVVQALAITAVPATALAFLIQNWVQKYTTSTRTALIFVTEPVFAAGFAYLWSGELLTFRGLVGCSLIIAGMILSEVRFHRI